MRKTLFFLTLSVGFGIALTTFLVSALTNPGIPFAPGLFVLGVILLFSSAVVYELVPDKARKKKS